MQIDDIMIKVRVSAEEAKETLKNVTSAVETLKNAAAAGAVQVQVNAPAVTPKTETVPKKSNSKGGSAKHAGLEEIEERLRAEEEYAEKKLGILESSAADELALQEKSQSGVVAAIRGFYNAYADAGAAVGGAFSAAFGERMAESRQMLEQLRLDYAAFGGLGGSGKVGMVNIYQTFNAQTDSPAAAAKAAMDAVESALKNK